MTGGAVGTSRSMAFTERLRDSVVKVVPAERLVVADIMELEGG
jgi:hypothetical protein